MPEVTIIIRNWKPIALTAAIGATVSLIVSLFIPPQYKSTVTLFPAKLASTSQIISQDLGVKDFMGLGEEEDLERLQQILLSEEIRNCIVEEFNLMDHYKISPDTKYPQTQLKKEYTKNVEIHKTRFYSIEISVTDRNPETAANIANRMAELIDTIFWAMQRERAEKAYNIVENEFNIVRQNIRLIEDSLQKIRNYGINNYRAEAEVLNAAYAEAIIKGNYSGAKQIEQKIENLSKYGGGSLSLLGELELEQKRLSFLRDKLAAAKINMEQIIPRKYIVNRAMPSEKKSWPIYWFNMLIGSLIMAVATLITLAILETKNNKQ